MNKNQSSLNSIGDALVISVKKLGQSVQTENDLRIGYEKILEPLLSKIGIETKPRYERLGTEAKAIYKGRPDAVHGQVIIEYKKPGTFSSPTKVEDAFGQLVRYMKAEAKGYKIDPFGLLNRLVGVGFDGNSIFFVRYYGKKPGKTLSKIDDAAFVHRGVYSFEPESARTFLTYLRSLARQPLTAENLAHTYGPNSTIASLAVSAFTDALENWGNQRVQVFFDEWQRLFGIVYGEQFSAEKQEIISFLTLYGVDTRVNFQKLLFSVHTYFAFLMKLIAAELLTYRDTDFHASFSATLTHSSTSELKQQLIDIEEGGIYARRGITNFLEGDFFCWYLDAWSPRLEEAIREITRTLSRFEPATSSIDPEPTRDLLKKLYQYLVPQVIRHKLGEYYTPDWLAELTLKEAGYDGNTLKRVIDPACGSGTFLVFAILQAKAYGQKHHEPPLETVKRIMHNVWGFDLNPLAIIAARTNYLFALGDLVNELQQVEIPIYLTDSVLTPTSTPGTAGKFDFVVGNPPWIRWTYLSKQYREITLPLWKEYGLFSLKGIDAWLGGSEKDFSMLFTYTSADYYLKDKAKLGFLITQEVFKAKKAGEGFRRFQLGNNEPLQVLKAHDLVSIQPFEGAANKTAIIILKKGQQTTYPVPYIFWSREKGVGKIATDATLEEALPLLKKKKLLAYPISGITGAWQTIEECHQEIVNIQGENTYQARLGARIEPYGVFWVTFQQLLSDGNLIIRNDIPKRAKRKVQQVETKIEPDLIFPIVRGKDIQRWQAIPKKLALITHNILENRPYAETEMKVSLPHTYAYLLRFKDTLLARKSHIILSLLRRHAFFVMSGMLPHIFTRYKVIWKRMATDIIAAVISQYKTPYGYKIIIPTDTTSLVATDNEGEAHYLCAIMNSQSVREFIKSYSSAGRGFGTPSVMEHIGIPKFDVNNQLQNTIAQLSQTLHERKADNNTIEITELEQKVNDHVHKLFGITR